MQNIGFQINSIPDKAIHVLGNLKLAIYQLLTPAILQTNKY
jgi:hypothetical protein